MTLSNDALVTVDGAGPAWSVTPGDGALDRRSRGTGAVGRYTIADEVVPGEERSLTVACDPRAFRLWAEPAGSLTTPSGGALPLARGLGDVRLEITRP